MLRINVFISKIGIVLELVNERQYLLRYFLQRSGKNVAGTYKAGPLVVDSATFRYGHQ